MQNLVKWGSLVLLLGVLQSCSKGDEPEPIDCDASDLQLELIAGVDPTECATPNGEISVQASGGAAPYEYSLDNVIFTSSSQFTNLNSGLYTVTVRDTNGCTRMVEATLISPGGVAVGASVEADTNCAEPFSGSISLMATGGTGEYQYRLDDGAFGVSSEFTQVAGGSHTVAVKDEAGCTVSITLTVPKQTSVTYTDNILPIFEAKCQFPGCHPDNGNWFSFSVANANADRIKQRTTERSMPKDGANAPGGALSDEQIALIACWVDSGAVE